MEHRTYHIGIIGTGRIAHRFVPEARTMEGVEVIAVYNPRISSASKFAEELQIEYSTDEIQAFLELVDIVYIASPHESHAEYSRLALDAGKHVLCEKPLCFSKQTAQELYALAEEKKCVLMEAIKTAYCPGFKGILDIVKSGRIGAVVDVEACFTKLSPSNVREIWDDKCGGSFMELGTYSLLPIVKLLGTESKKTSFWSLDSKIGVDGYTKATIDYGKATGLAKAGLAAKSEGQLVIAGTKGYILVPSPWWLTKYIEVHYEDPNKVERYSAPFEGAGLRYEVGELINRINGYKQVDGVTPEESIWIAGQMEKFLEHRAETKKQLPALKTDAQKQVGIWAHRGCSMAYPENTLEAFEVAAKLNGITGIELDVQLTKDKEIVVIHDETVDRTTSGTGNVCEYTLEEIKRLTIKSVNDTVTYIPTLEEVFELLAPYCKQNGLLINIELKTSRVRYEGIEEQTMALVEKFGLEDYIVYSSFLPESVGLIKQINSKAKTGTLASDITKCLKDAKEQQADALHPSVSGLDMLDNAPYAGYPIRAYNSEEPFFGQDRVLKEKKMTKYALLGVTDIITNVPEMYL